MRRPWMIVVAGLVALAFAAALECAHAQQPVSKLHLGANVIAFDDDVRPSDLELGATGRSSLSPHLALVGSVWYGVDKSYLRGSAGIRATATEPDNRNFSVGVGIEYQVSSEPAIRPEEFLGNVSLGWRPWPEQMPKVVIGGQAGYGLDTGQAHILGAIRYEISAF